MFDGISLNDRILGSRFDQARTSLARTAPEAEDAKERMEIRHTSFVRKMICTLQMSQRVEIVSNIEPKKIGLIVRRNGPQLSICVRTFSPITN